MLIPNVGQIILIIIIMKMADEKMADEAAHRCVFTERTDTSVAAIKKSAGSRGQAHFADAPSLSLLIHLLKAEGRCRVRTAHEEVDRAEGHQHLAVGESSVILMTLSLHPY